MSEHNLIDAAKRALPLIDLANLDEGCKSEAINALCERGVTKHGSVAAVCVWPRFARQAAAIMLGVIEQTRREKSFLIGFKPAGGIRTVEGAAYCLDLADRIMGTSWASTSTFRFGASGLLDDVLATLDGSAPVSGGGY